MATSLLGLGLLVSAGTATAQTPPDRGVFVPPSFPTIPAQPVPPPAPRPPAKTPQLPREAVHEDVVQLPEASATVFPETIITAVAQGPMDKLQPKSNFEDTEYPSLSVIPGLEVLTRLETEEEMKQRWIQKGMKTGERLVFPEEPVLSKEPYPGRFWAPKVKLVEPAFVAHGRLYFEQPNLERGLWDLGIVTPVVSVGKFYWDLATLPYQCATRPCEKCETSAGKCLPGDPAPFFIYPPELSLTGLAAEAAVVSGAFFVFP